MRHYILRRIGCDGELRADEVVEGSKYYQRESGNTDSLADMKSTSHPPERDQGK